MLLPKDNAKDIPELPERVRQDMELIPVSHLDEVMAVALLEPVGPPMKVTEPEHAPEPSIVPPLTSGNGGDRIGRAN